MGKSTVATNLALAFAAEGLKTGILDADLYGPSIPKLLGLEGKPAVREDGIFSPHQAFGLKAMSIGSMLTPGQAVVWRGPMATSALRQLLRETDWGGLDLLVVDLPPGTGDIQISLVQQVPLLGAVIVSTPQDLALIDAQKAIDMIKRLSIPLLGLVENMSYFVAPDTGKRYDIFGHGGAPMPPPTASISRSSAKFGDAVPRMRASRCPLDMRHPRDLGWRRAGGVDRRSAIDRSADASRFAEWAFRSHSAARPPATSSSPAASFARRSSSC